MSKTNTKKTIVITEEQKNQNPILKVIYKRTRNLNKKLLNIETLEKIQKQALKPQQILKLQKKQETLKQIQKNQQFTLFYKQILQESQKDKTFNKDDLIKISSLLAIGQHMQKTHNQNNKTGKNVYQSYFKKINDTNLQIPIVDRIVEITDLLTQFLTNQKNYQICRDYMTYLPQTQDKKQQKVQDVKEAKTEQIKQEKVQSHQVKQEKTENAEKVSKIQVKVQKIEQKTQKNQQNKETKDEIEIKNGDKKQQTNKNNNIDLGQQQNKQPTQIKRNERKDYIKKDNYQKGPYNKPYNNYNNKNRNYREDNRNYNKFDNRQKNQFKQKNVDKDRSDTSLQPTPEKIKDKRPKYIQKN